MNANLLLLPLACLALVTSAAKLGKRGGKGGGKFRALQQCCPKIPIFLTEDSIKACAAERKASRAAARGAAAPPPPAEESSGQAGNTANDKKKGKNRADKASRGCMMECAFKANGFTTTGADGNEILNMKALNDKLDTLATGEWEPIIKAAKENCTASLPSVRQGQNCTSGANTVAKCLIRYMFVHCPGLDTSSVCSERLQKISQWRTGKKGGKGRNRQRSDVMEDTDQKKDELEALVQEEGSTEGP